ncbi:MAG: hypothetical protein QOD51_1772, partial [Candidatus Eremiobacteraeota bacterium]|nr:hypothetical protein [Candidatus Eremiobacteraeota bacterium]
MGYRLRHEVYAPELDDWLWYAVLPLAAYAAIFAAALWLRAGAAEALVAIAAAVMLLIFIGIHNAWDVVTYLAVGKVQEPDDGADAQPAPADDHRSEPVPAAAATAAVMPNAARDGGPPPVA